MIRDNLRRWSESGKRFGYFGASADPATALVVAAELSDVISATVSRGGRPDLAGGALGGNDPQVLRFIREALSEEPQKREIIPGAAHLFEERGALEAVGPKRRICRPPGALSSTSSNRSQWFRAFGSPSRTGCATFSKHMTASLSGQVALVTGSAKRLGREVARRLASEGADIVVHYHNSKSEAHDVVCEVEKMGGHSVALRANLADVSDINQLFRQVADHFGRLNILVNSAANFLAARFGETSEELWDSSLDTNLKAAFFCAQEGTPLLKKGNGVIINFADGGGLVGWPGYIPHSVSKAGVIMLTRCLAKALAPEVRVNAIAPGTITMPGDPPEWEADYIRCAPLRRSGRPEDVGDAVSFLVHATFMTGQVLILDGGRSL